MYAAGIVVLCEQLHHVPSMKPYDIQITPASRLSSLVSHSPHNPFLKPGHLDGFLRDHRMVVKAPKKLGQLAYLERGWHSGFLEHDADVRAVFGETGVLAKERDTATAGPAHADHQRDRGGFAGSLGPRRATTSPGSTVRLMPLRAWTLP